MHLHYEIQNKHFVTNYILKHASTTDCHKTNLKIKGVLVHAFEVSVNEI